jgi:hypothetical protein
MSKNGLFVYQLPVFLFVFSGLVLVFFYCVQKPTRVLAAQPSQIERKPAESRVFCNGLNIPQERQCPTMADL